MNVDELRSVLRTERQKDSLQHLRESFYDDVAAYIAEQKAQRNRKAEELGTHYSPEIRRITDEIETAEEVVTSIYERRVGKVVKAASFAAAGMSSDTDGLTHEEKRLFEDLVARIEQNRSTVLSTLEGVDADDAPAPTSTGGVSTPDSAAPEKQSASGARPDAADPSSDPAIPPDEPDPEDAEAATRTDGDAGDVLADAMGGGSDTTAADTTATPESTRSATSDAGTGSGTGAGPDADAGTAADERGDASDGDRPSTEAMAVAADDTPADGPGSTPSAVGGSVTPDDAVVDDATPDDAVVDDATPDDDPLSGLADERETVRITADVGSILGVDDREYDLAREDVVTLPSANAEPLVERGAAERLE